MKSTLIFLLLALANSSMTFAGPTDPKIRWKQYITPHFKIIYDEKNDKMAETYGEASEWAYGQILPIFRESPALPITVVISDQTDFANGAATFLPYQMISVYPVMPLASDSIDNYESWAADLMIHELTHIFNMSPAHGFYVPLNYIFGSIVRPNGILPRWYLEGLAVELESSRTRAGRLRSPYLFGQWRALASSERFQKEDISHVNEQSIASYPFGQRPYSFGSLLIHGAVEDVGVGLIHDLNQNYSRRLPFLLNGPIEEKSGIDWSQRWEKLKVAMADEAQQLQQLLTVGGVMDSAPLLAQSGSKSLPVLSPDGNRLAYLVGQPYQNTSIQVIDIKSKKVLAKIDTFGTTRISWFGDNQRLLFNQTQLFNHRYKFNDLYVWNTAQLDQGSERLTFGARSQDAEVSKDSNKIVFVQNDGGKTKLILFDVATKATSELLSPRLGIRISSPTWISSRELAFVGRDSKGIDRVYRLHLDHRKRKTAFESKGHIASLRSQNNGLLIADSSSGIYNLYHLNENGTQEAITNSKTGVLSGTIDDKNSIVYFSEMTSEGLDLFQTTLSIFHPPLVGPPSYAGFQNSLPGSQRMSLVKGKTEDYSPWSYLIPRYWVPFFYPVEGGVLLQGTTETFDPTFRHGVNLAATFDSVTNQASYDLRYLNSTTAVDLAFNVAETNELISADSDPITNRYFGLSGSFYLLDSSNAWRGMFAGTSVATETPISGIITHFDRLGASTGLNYSSAAASLLPSRHGDTFFNFNETHYFPGSNRLSYNHASAIFGGRLRDPLPSRHSLLLQLKGSHAPQVPLSKVTSFGDRTIGGNYLVSLINSNYLLRGYPSGAIVGRSLANANLEYHFPLFDIDKGYGTFPLFLRNIETAIIFDAAAVDGAYRSVEQNSYFRSQMGNIYAGTGVEFILANTMAYHLPLTLTVAYYYGFQEQAGGGSTLFLSFGYVGHGGVDAAEKRTTLSLPSSFD